MWLKKQVKNAQGSKESGECLFLFPANITKNHFDYQSYLQVITFYFVIKSSAPFPPMFVKSFGGPLTKILKKLEIGRN